MNQFACFRRTLSAVALLLALGTPATWAQPVQALGIPAKQSVRFEGSVPAMVRAFCLEERVMGAPGAKHRLETGVGQVWVHFHDGTSREMALQEALSRPHSNEEPLICMRGVGTGSAENAELTGRADVAGVEFITASAVFAGDVRLSEKARVAVAEDVARALRYYEPSLSYSFNQRLVWPSPIRLIDEPLEKGVRVVRLASQDATKFLSVRFVRLNEQADCSLVGTPQGEYLLHDAGASVEELTSILRHVPIADGARRIRVIITHPDLDHYRGLSWLLDQAESQTMGEPRVIVDDVLIGTPVDRIATAQSDPGYTRAFKDVVVKLERAFSLSPAPGGFARFIRVGMEKTIDLSSLDTYPISSSPGMPNVLDLPIDTGCRITIFSPGDPAAIPAPRHAYNLIVRYEHRGFSVLDAGDAHPRQLLEFLSATHKDAWITAKLEAEEIRESLDLVPLVKGDINTRIAEIKRLTEPTALHKRQLAALKASLDALPSEADAEEYSRRAARLKKKVFEGDVQWQPSITDQHTSKDLHIDVFKWPHHVWRPTSTWERNIIKAFIKAYRPREILVVVPRSPSPEIKARLTEIERLIQEAKNEERHAGRKLDTVLQPMLRDNHHETDYRAVIDGPMNTLVALLGHRAVTIGLHV